MGTSADRAAASTDFYSRGDYVPGIRVRTADTRTLKKAKKLFPLLVSVH
jgi:pyruvate dehydrogenase E1 component alpha subunit